MFRINTYDTEENVMEVKDFDGIGDNCTMTVAATFTKDELPEFLIRLKELNKTEILGEQLIITSCYNDPNNGTITLNIRTRNFDHLLYQIYMLEEIDKHIELETYQWRLAKYVDFVIDKTPYLEYIRVGKPSLANNKNSQYTWSIDVKGASKDDKENKRR